MIVDIPGLRLGRGGNDRKHWRAADQQKKVEKHTVSWALRGAGVRAAPPSSPCVVTITRIAPGNGLDSDNNVGACKYVRDAIAQYLAVCDKSEDVVRYTYAQQRGPWGVRVEIEAAL